MYRRIESFMTLIARNPSLLLAVLAVQVFAQFAEARENHAILIGVSRYETLDEKYWLNGPANDVQLAYHYLTTAANPAFKPENISVLADGVQQAEHPTLSSIRASFAELVERVEDGDFVYLHFAGHGTQAPAQHDQEELDGLDEVFLPVDIGPWNDTIGTVENGLVDDEIGRFLDQLTTKGVDVWVVFDTCHSGTATRAAPIHEDQTRLRKVLPQALGVPAPLLSEPSPTAASRKNTLTTQKTGTGSVTAFFAAQTNETTPERPLPSGGPDQQPYGVFTYVLFETMLQNPGISYRQLGQEILRQYAVQNLSLTTPMFTGDLDQSLFSAGPQERVFQWRIEATMNGYAIPAGSVHGLENGDELQLYERASDSMDQALGVFKVSSAKLLTSQVEPIGEVSVPSGAFLRAEQSKLHLGLTVALPPKSGNAELDQKAAAALDLLVSQNAHNQRVRFVEPGKDADIHLSFVPNSPRPDALWLLPITGFWQENAADSTPSVSTSDKSPQDLANVLQDMLVHIGRAKSLLKLGGAFGAGSSGVKSGLLVKEAGTSDLKEMNAASVPNLFPNDEVHLVAENTTGGPLDLNVLFVGSDYSIHHIFAGRLQPGDTFKRGLLRITDSTVGRERILVIANPAAKHSTVQNFAFLQQEAMPVSRSLSSPNFATALAEVGFGSNLTRGFSMMGADDSEKGEILQFEINVRSGVRGEGQ